MQFRQTPILRPEAPDWSGPLFRPLYAGMSYARIARGETDRFQFSAIEPVWSLRLVLRGKARLTVGDQKHGLAPGQGFMGEGPSQGHWTKLPGKERSAFLFASFIGPLADAFCRAQVQCYGTVFRFEPDGPTARATNRLVRLAQRKIRRDAGEWSRHAFEVLEAWRHETQKHAANQPRLGDQPTPSRLVSSRINNVTEFARELGYSRSYLSGRLSYLWQDRPGALLRDARLRHAAELLQTTDHSIAIIAEQTGYAETASFSRAFKRHHGVTPSQFRRQPR